MALAVNKDTCIGCGNCAQVCPGSFVMEADGKAKAIKESPCATQALEECPVDAISR